MGVVYRVDYYRNGRWHTWGVYEDADEAKDNAYEHQRIYGDDDVRVVPIPRIWC